MQELVTTGRTVEEAVEAACTELGLGRDSVTVEILEMPTKRLFGMSPAKVKVTTTQDVVKVSELLAAEPDEPQTPAEKSERPRRENPRPKQQTKKPHSAEHNAAPAEKKSADRPARQLEELPFVPVDESELSDSTRQAVEYLKNLAGIMGASELEYSYAKAGETVKIIVDGADAAILIGRRGETMDALQYLCSLTNTRRAGGSYSKVVLDVANYRSKREKTLQALAVRIAEKVRRTKHSQTLEPMNPYERRIVHSAVQGIEGVKSESIGEDPNRCIVISAEGYPRGGGRPPRGRDNRSRSRGGDRYGSRLQHRSDSDSAAPADTRPAHSAAADEQRAPKEAPEGATLYSKIEL